MKKEKRVEASNQPWGTPASIGKRVEVWPSAEQCKVDTIKYTVFKLLKKLLILKHRKNCITHSIQKYKNKLTR